MGWLTEAIIILVIYAIGKQIEARSERKKKWARSLKWKLEKAHEAAKEGDMERYRMFTKEIEDYSRISLQKAGQLWREGKLDFADD